MQPHHLAWLVGRPVLCDRYCVAQVLATSHACLLSFAKTCRHKQNPIDFERAGLKNEWDPRGTLFFIKKFEQEFDRGNVCLVWSGLDDKQLGSYKASAVLGEPNEQVMSSQSCLPEPCWSALILTIAGQGARPQSP